MLKGSGKFIQTSSTVALALSALLGCGLDLKSLTKQSNKSDEEVKTDSGNSNEEGNRQSGSITLDLSGIQLDNLNLGEQNPQIGQPAPSVPQTQPQPATGAPDLARALPFSLGYIISVTVNGLIQVHYFKYPAKDVALDKVPVGKATVKIELVHHGIIVKSGEANVGILAGQRATAVISLSRETTGSLIVLIKDQDSEQEQICAQPFTCSVNAVWPTVQYIARCRAETARGLFAEEVISECPLTQFKLRLCRSGLAFTAQQFANASCTTVGAQSQGGPGWGGGNSGSTNSNNSGGANSGSTNSNGGANTGSANSNGGANSGSANSNGGANSGSTNSNNSGGANLVSNNGTGGGNSVSNNSGAPNTGSTNSSANGNSVSNSSATSR